MPAQTPEPALRPPPDLPTEFPAGRPNGADQISAVDRPTRPRVVVTSLRMRIVTWVLLLLSLILLVTVITTALFLWVRLDNRITTELLGDAAELRLYAQQGVDPSTGEAFTSPEALLNLHLQNTLPDAYETMFSVVDGEVSARTADEPPIRLDEDPALVQRAAAATNITLGSMDSAAGRVRYVLVPVRTMASDQQGTLVIATFVAAETREILGTILGMAAVAAGAIALSAGLSWWVAGRALAPLAVMGTTARQITETDLSRRIPLRHDPGTAPRDELDDLAVTFNDTLDRLERAVLAQRRFVDDAGHELRTPLTIVRGHLELLEDDPAERASTMALVDDELRRMSRLVADLLTLTKADDPAFVRTTSCNLATLTEDMLVKASALAPRRWVLDEVPDWPADADARPRADSALGSAAPSAENGAWQEPNSVAAWPLGPDEPRAHPNSAHPYSAHPDSAHPNSAHPDSAHPDSPARLASGLPVGSPAASDPVFLTDSRADTRAESWASSAVGPHVGFRADCQRLTQAVLALADNAVRYTGEGDEIGIGSRVNGNAVQLWVRDTGSGVHPEQGPRLFSLFSHDPDSPGAGLGLAIVAAIARAHGGRADWRPTPGGGSTFLLLLPLAGDPVHPAHPAPAGRRQIPAEPVSAVSAGARTAPGVAVHRPTKPPQSDSPGAAR